MPEAAARAARGRRLGGEPQGGDPASESPGTDRSPPRPLRGPPWDSWRTRACTPVCVSASDDGADGATRASLGRGAPRRGLPGGRVFRRRELSRCRLRPHREQHGWLRWAGSRDAQCGQLLPALLGQPGLHAGPSRGAGGSTGWGDAWGDAWGGITSQGQDLVMKAERPVSLPRLVRVLMEMSLSDDDIGIRNKDSSPALLESLGRGV